MVPEPMALNHTESSPKVTIIVVNWNGRDFLDVCLVRLSLQTYPDREIILVDNNSKDFSVSFVREKFPAIKIIELDDNRGFTGGNLEGLKAARGEFIAL